MNKREFVAALAGLEAATGHSFTKHQTQAWFELLSDLTTEALQAGVKRVLLEREYPGLPPIGLLRRYASESTHGIAITSEQAFERVREAVSRFGWPNPKGAASHLGTDIWAVVQGIGGWERICDSPVDQRQSLFAQFRDGWQRQQGRLSQRLQLPADVRPQERIENEVPAPCAGVRLLAESFSVETT